MLVGGVGEINFGKQYRQGNRIYDSNHIAMCLTSQPVGNAGGQSYLYIIDDSYKNRQSEFTKTIAVLSERGAIQSRSHK